MKYIVIYENENHFFDDYELAKSEYDLHGGLFLEQKCENVYEAVVL
jgi:hypothetical protein